MNKFWDFGQNTDEERILWINGQIAEESWWGDEITPAEFDKELNSEIGDITVWINSPGGDCIAAARIYNMLKAYKGFVTVKIDGIAASAASVIAMAGDKVLMSPVAMIMIHNPATFVCGDHAEMKKAIEMLNEVKESIINAYTLRTKLSRAEISEMMDNETWMSANKAVELGFADGVIGKDNTEPFDFSAKLAAKQFLNKLSKKTQVSELKNKLETLYKNF